MAYFNEKVTVVKDFSTIKATDISTAGTIADLDTTGTSFVRLTAATQLTSLLVQSSGKQLVLVNASGGALLVKNLSGTAGNQINTGNGADLSLPTGASITLIYDDGSSVWRRGEYVPVVPSSTTVVQSGNSFGADFTIGANDNFNAIIKANNAEVIRARPAAAANADVKVTGTGGLEIPVGTTGQRPSSPVTGTLRLNSTIPALEGYYNSTWNQIGTSTVVSPILGLQTATAIPAGYIGQEITDFKATGTTYFAGSGSAGNAFFLTLTAGIWEISYTFSIDTTAGAYSTGYRLLTWVGVTTTGTSAATTRNGLVDNISTTIPTIGTNASGPIRVTYDGSTLTLPDGSTNATGLVYMKSLSTTYSGTPTYGCFMRAVRVQ